MAGLPGDVVRVLGWDELPPSVREIPKAMNPLEEGVLMQHQRDWIKLINEHDLCLAEKGRRTGITWATAKDDTITAASSRQARGDNVYYVGDTKEKGLEFIGYCAHMARVMAVAMAEGWQSIEVFLFEDQQADGSSKHITSYRIRFASSFQIVALSSSPASIRGLQGIVNIDEAAFHQNVQAVIDAALALIIWGGKIRIISTHNGAKNPVNQLIRDTRAGLYAFKILHVTFDDAVANGLYERVCLIKGWTPTPQGKKAWYHRVRGAYGANKAAMREELDAIPREGSGVAIAGILIEQCMPAKRPVIRLDQSIPMARPRRPLGANRVDPHRRQAHRRTRVPLLLSGHAVAAVRRPHRGHHQRGADQRAQNPQPCGHRRKTGSERFNASTKGARHVEAIDQTIKAER